MKLSEIRPNQGSINVEAVVTEMEPPREINKFGNSLKVANAVVQDDSGKMRLTLWNAEIEKVKVGDKIKITNGYAKEFKGEIQLTAGKFGKIEVIGQEDVSKLPAPKVEGKVDVAEEDSSGDDEDEW